MVNPNRLYSALAWRLSGCVLTKAWRAPERTNHRRASANNAVPTPRFCAAGWTAIRWRKPVVRVRPVRACPAGPAFVRDRLTIRQRCSSVTRVASTNVSWSTCHTGEVCQKACCSSVSTASRSATFTGCVRSPDGLRRFRLLNKDWSLTVNDRCRSRRCS